MEADYSFTRQGRSGRTLAILIGIYAVLLGAIFLIDAAWWLMAALGVVTLPALFDLWRNPSAGVELNHQRLAWHTGARAGSLDLGEIDFMRFDTRFDFSVRVTAVLITGKRIRLPYEAIPPHKTFEAELVARGLRVDRHHFVVF